MKVLLIHGGTPLPEALREVIARGSTSLLERRAGDIATDAALIEDADRVIFWAPAGDVELVALATRLASASLNEPGDRLIFITANDAPRISGLSARDTYAWPRDADRLAIAFLTGA